MKRLAIVLLFLWSSCHTPAPARVPSPPEPLLVDVDMGLDDARVLLALTRQGRYHVEAVITVEGSGSARRGAENALRLLAAAGVHDIPVAIGAERALAGPIAAPPWRGLTDSLGGLKLPPARRRAEPRTGVDLLRERLRSAHAPLPVLALGPVTNLALALRAEPSLARQIAVVYLLGDFVRCDCYNCRTDPEAAALLRGSGVPLYMVMRTATDPAPFDAALLSRVRALRGPVARLIAGFMAAHASPGLKLWDDVVLAGLVDPGLLRYEGTAPNVFAARRLDPSRLQRTLLALWDMPAPFSPMISRP